MMPPEPNDDNQMRVYENPTTKARMIKRIAKRKQERQNRKR